MLTYLPRDALFAQLGLKGDADERDVRRAYARLLRQNRPDDDPAAFQRLNEAYRACLQCLRHDEALDDEDDMPDAGSDLDAIDAPDLQAAAAAASAPSRAPRCSSFDPAPHGFDTEAPRFALAPFLATLVALGRRDRREDVRAFLCAQPALYSLRTKTAVAGDVLAAIAELQPPLPLSALDAVGDFFQVEALGPADWPLRERHQQARRRAHADPPRDSDVAVARALADPDCDWRWWWLLLMPLMPTRARAQLEALDADGIAVANSRGRQILARLFERDRVTGEQVTLALLRTLAFVVPLVFLAGVLSGRSATTGLLLAAASLPAGLAWQALRAAQLRLQPRYPGLSDALLHATTAGFAAAAFALGAMAGGPRLPAYVLAFAAMLHALRPPRLGWGLATTLPLLMSELLLLGAPGPARPLPLGLGAILATTLLVLALDVARSRREKIPASQLAQTPGWVRFAFIAAMLSLPVAMVFAAPGSAGAAHS